MMSERPHRVAVLALPAVIPLELGIATEIFGRDPHYRLTVCAEGRSASLPGSGLTVNTPAGLEGLERADTLIIPGYEDADATVSTAVLDAIRVAQPPLRRRRRHPHVGWRNHGYRLVPPPRPARLRLRSCQHTSPRPRGSATASRRASAVHRTAHARRDRRPTRPPSRLDARKPCTSARPRHARDPSTYVSTDVEPSVS